MTISETSATTRTLRQLTLPTKLHVPGGTAIRRGLFVDCETTGRDWARDEVIEVALLPFTYTLDGRIVEVQRDEAQSYRQDPGRPLSAEIAALTGMADIERSWWTDLSAEMLEPEPELEWLKETCLTHYDPFRVGFKRENIPIGSVTAYDRWRANPADIAGAVAWGEAPSSPWARAHAPA